MIKLIASDMDGTLLNSDLQVSRENIEAIQKAEALGIEFMIATGRNREEALPPLQEAGIHCAMITLNGAQIFDKDGHETHVVPIDKNYVLKMIELFERNQVYYEFATDESTYSQSQEKRIEIFSEQIATKMTHLTKKMAIAMAVAHLEFFPIRFVPSLKEFAVNENPTILKMLCFSPKDDGVLEKIAKQLSAHEELSVTSSGFSNLEINHKDAQKGIAVARAAYERNLKADEVFTIGDNLNDLSMIQYAGVGFAMENAVSELKEYAKYTTTSNNQSGVGKAIQRAISENL